MRHAAALIAAAILLIAAPAASAKEITKVRVCGLDGCVTTRDTAIVQGLMNGGPPTVPPAMRGGVISLRGTVTHEGETIGRTQSWWVPALHLLVAEDGTWMPLPARSAAALERVTRGLEPLPPATIGLTAQTPAAPAHHALEGEGGTDWLLIALGSALVAAVAAAVLVVRRRPPRGRTVPSGM
jgi:hypothetical protein